VSAIWRNTQIKDDSVKQSNRRGYITFATAGPNTRTTQVFINFRDNAGLDKQGFAPFGQVVEGMNVVDRINSQYEGKPQEQFVRILNEGNAFLNKEFPKLDFIKKASIEP
jgi:peptidyl-prolyl cis-trans isomerase A (cyclophilin A)